MTTNNVQCEPQHPALTYPIVPLGVFASEREAERAGEVLAEGGLPVLEVALRTPASLAALARVRDHAPSVCVGAGTVLTAAHARDALAAGAQFLVSPGLSDEVLDVAAQAGVPAVPGVSSASEVQHAVGKGLSRLKLFPANALNATALISALRSVFSDVTYMPSGGVNAQNFTDFLALDGVEAVSGSWVLKNLDADGAAARVREVVDAATRTLAHKHGKGTL